MVEGKPRGNRHLRREDLKVEAEAVVGERGKIRRKSGSSARSACFAKRYRGLSCQWSCMRMPRTSGILASRSSSGRTSSAIRSA